MAAHRESADKILGYSGKVGPRVSVDFTNRTNGPSRFPTRVRRPILRTTAEFYVRKSAGISIIKYRFLDVTDRQTCLLYTLRINKMNTLTISYIVDSSSNIGIKTRSLRQAVDKQIFLSVSIVDDHKNIVQVRYGY